MKKKNFELISGEYKRPLNFYSVFVFVLCNCAQGHLVQFKQGQVNVQWGTQQAPEKTTP